MAKLLIVSVLWFCVQSVVAQIVFEQSLSEAFAKAKREKKLVFVKYYNSDCPVCQNLEIYLNQPELSNFYNRNFVSYGINIKNISEEDKKFLQEANLHFTSVPFLLFFDADKKFLHYSHIQLNSNFLFQIAQNALTPQERTINLENKYKAGDRSIRTLYAYNNYLQVQKKDDLARVVAKDLYDNFPKNELATKKSFIITKDCVTDVDNGFFQFWIENMDKATSFQTIEETKNKLGEIITKSIYYPNRPVWSLEKIAKVKSYILKTELSKNPDNFFWQEESKILIEQKREKEALELGKKIFDAETELASKLFTLQHFAELCKEKTSIQTLQDWLKTLQIANAEAQEQADYFYVELVCLKKLGNKKLFNETYQKAKTYYRKNNLDTKSIDALLQSKKQ